MKTIKNYTIAVYELIKKNVLSCYQWFVNGWKTFLQSSWKVQAVTFLLAIVLAMSWPFASVAFATEAMVNGVDMEIGTLIVLTIGAWLGMISVAAMEIIVILSIPVIHHLVITLIEKVKAKARNEAYS